MLVKEKIVVQSETKNLLVVRDFIGKVAHVAHIPLDHIQKITLAVDEAVTNVIEHGYAHPRGQIEIEVEVRNESIKVYIRDKAHPFNPATFSELPKIDDHIRLGRKSGFGIFLIRRVMDEVCYNLKEGACNELILVKYIKPKHITEGQTC